MDQFTAYPARCYKFTHCRRIWTLYFLFHPCVHEASTTLHPYHVTVEKNDARILECFELHESSRSLQPFRYDVEKLHVPDEAPAM